ncbi:cytochrome P450 [Marasmius fiardii PR-910]|nr:cytochrome P450 [Marasmius fiardii PR-910]
MTSPLNTAHSWPLLAVTVVICMGATALFALLKYVRRDLHVADIPGPVDNASWLYGNFPEFLLSQPYGKCEFKWQEQYGSICRFKGCFSEDILLISDPAALRYILNDATLFDLSHNRRFISIAILRKESVPILRNGGETHRRIKNAFSATFTATHLQRYVPVMREIAQRAADKLMQHSETNEKNATVDIYQILQHSTSDIIGEVGFGYKFNALETDGKHEVVQSHQHVLMLGGRRSKSVILSEGVIPYLPRMILKPMLQLPLASFRTFHDFRDIIETWAAGLLTDHLRGEDNSDAGLIGLVAFANNNQKRERLSSSEISHQAGALLVAGQDTTANALAWAFYELAKRPDWQDRIRKEIMEAQQSDSGFDKFEYLNAHIKETLRFHSSVPLSERVAYEDAVLPLSRPITTISGRTITELPIRKGQAIYIGVAAFNRDSHIWGPDANVFEPLRWLDGRYISANLPGIGPYSNLASFGGGFRTCLGWRLAILELQVVLAELVPKFRFSFTSEQENDVTSCFSLSLVPLSRRSGKPTLSMVAQPIHASD